MKTLIHKKDPLISILISVVFAVSLTACSEDEKSKAAKVTAEKQNAKEEFNTFDHPHGPEITDLQKHKFEHDFAAQCVQRELKNSTNKEADEARLTKSCECIATYMMKDLTSQEAEKFIGQHEHPQSLRIKFEAAAYQCLQENAHPAGPKLFGKQQ